MFALLARATYHKREVFSVDFEFAYPNKLRTAEVIYKDVMLDKEIAEIVVEIEPSWKEFLQPDGKMLIEMDRMLYGYKEAGKMWNEVLVAMFVKHGFVVSTADPCYLRLRRGADEVDLTISTDDCLFSVTSDELKQEMIKLCRDTFKRITIQEGESFSHFGMQLTFDEKEGATYVDQRKWAADLTASVPGVKHFKTPCSADILVDHRDDEPACDRERFRSLVQSCLYGGKRTYPEILFPASILASRITTATTSDMASVERIIGYIAGQPGHRLTIKPGSMQVAISCDASWAIAGGHEKRKSHSGFCIGFKGAASFDDCYLIFCSLKQSIVAYSSMESELIAATEASKYAIWFQRLMEDFGEGDHGPMELQQDNTSTIAGILTGHGSFKATKHIEKDYYAITENLIVPGKMVVAKVHTSEMSADLLTKPVIASDFAEGRARLLGGTY
jgi:hypothetical protein